MIRPITAEWPARHSVFFLLCLLSGLSYGGAGGQSNNSQVTLHAWLESSNYSQAVPIAANFDQWQTDNFAQGERIYSKQLAYAGAAIGNTRFGFHSRLHYYLDFSNDTSLWYYLEKNDEERLATIKRPLDISLAINQLAARGYFVSHRFHWTHFSLRLRANYLQLSDLTYGASWGTYEPNLTLENQTQLTVDYSYSSRETILDREVDAVAGSGWIIDFAIDWQQGKQSASFDVNEAWSRLHWRAAPASRIQGNLVDLKIRRDAALQFDEFYSEVRQTLPAHSRLSYQYQLYPRLALGINSEQLSRQRWHRVFLQTPLWDAASFTLAYAPFDKFAKLGLHTKHFYLQLESNDSDWKDARLLNASIGLSFPIF